MYISTFLCNHSREGSYSGKFQAHVTSVFLPLQAPYKITCSKICMYVNFLLLLQINSQEDEEEEENE